MEFSLSRLAHSVNFPPHRRSGRNKRLLLTMAKRSKISAVGVELIRDCASRNPGSGRGRSKAHCAGENWTDESLRRAPKYVKTGADVVRKTRQCRPKRGESVVDDVRALALAERSREKGSPALQELAAASGLRSSKVQRILCEDLGSKSHRQVTCRRLGAKMKENRKLVAMALLRKFAARRPQCRIDSTSPPGEKLFRRGTAPGPTKNRQRIWAAQLAGE